MEKCLRALQKQPFEPLQKASLKMVTLKTVFLIAITTFRRCSDLHSLHLGEGFVTSQKAGITFKRHDLSKQDRQGHSDMKIYIPAFPENKYLNPKRSLYYYLKQTEPLRKQSDGSDQTKVFLSMKEPHHPVTADNI